MSTKRPSPLAKLLIVVGWIAVAVATNVILALLPSKASVAESTLLPQDARTSAATSRIAQAFPGTGTNAIIYLVLESTETLGATDKQYSDAVIGALRADTTHVGSVLDWWSDPLTAPLGTSADDRSGIAVVWLRGEAGTAQAQESLNAAQALVRQLPPPAGLRARIVAPAMTNVTPLRMTAWQGVAVAIAAILIAVLLLLRAGQPTLCVTIALLTAGLSLASALPLAMVMQRNFGGNISTFSGTVAVILTISTVTTSTMLVAQRKPNTSDSTTDQHPYRDMLPRLALPGASVAIITVPLLLARTPALHSIGTAALSVVVALAASLTLLPSLMGLSGTLPGLRGQPPRRNGGAGWTRRFPIPTFSHPIVVTAVVLAICALPAIGMRSSLTENPAGKSPTQILPGNPLPDVVVVKSDRSLRDPAGLIAIDQLSHHLMEIPGVRKVQSAAWPGGIPWSDASLTSEAGRMADQLNQQTGSFLPQIRAIKSLASTLDQVSGAVDELQSNMNVSLAAANQMQQNIGLMLSATRNLRGKTADASEFVDTLRSWMSGIANCPDSALCSTMHDVVDPFDKVVNDVSVLSTGADRISAESRKVLGSFSSVPQLMTPMRSALEEMRSFVPRLESTVQDLMPQLVQMSALLKSLSVDFADSGVGGFHLSRKALADPSYQHVLLSMFSPDGTATRLFIYSDDDTLDLKAAARAQQLDIAAGKAMKYGSLVNSQITVGGAAQVAAANRDALTHDAVLLALTMLAAVAVASVWRGVVCGLVVGLGVLASYLAALGISVALWQHLLGHDLHATVPLVSFAILAALGTSYLIAAQVQAAQTVSVRRAVAPLTAVGAVFAGGLVMVSGGSLSALSQIGTVLVIGLAALTAAARAWIPTAPRQP